jgi:hypothetical protein
MFAKDLIYLNNHDLVLENNSKINEIREGIKDGQVYIFKNVLPKEKIALIKNYLTQVGQNSLPNYKKIEAGCPNFHRINIWDARSYVLCCFHQFTFFPWNQDIFSMFNLFKKAYELRNLVNGNPREKFLGIEPEDGCIGRLSFQFYPSGAGGMNKHLDPVDHHQLAVPMMMMTKKGIDFNKGGAFVEKENGQRLIIDDFTDYGDIVYFNAQIPHGVDKIDPDSELNWLSFKGRWIVIFAVNKLFNNANIKDAVDLEKEEVF